MDYTIKRAAVIGSGVMGSSIAAHLANVGIPTLMLDVMPKKLTNSEKKKGLTLEDKAVRNRIVNNGMKALSMQKPSPITTKESLKLIEAGNMVDDIEKLKEADWIIEVVVENLDIKKQVFTLIDKYRKTGSIISSNTSGISVTEMTKHCSEDLRKHFLGTHFFNPPRYMKLLEIIPIRETDQAVLTYMKIFAENVLGKGVVEAKDTPNFIANRIGTYGLLITVREMFKHDLRIGEVDSVTGSLIGRPKSATFRTLDIVGLDTFLFVAKNIREQVEGKQQEIFTVPNFMLQMYDSGWIGTKSGRGFYYKEKGINGSTIYEINPESLEYENRTSLTTPAVEMAKQAKGTRNKLKTILSMQGDKASDFIWSILKPVLLYSGELLGEIADDIISIDEAMRWGFGWELGPFELWDAIGVEDSVERMRKEGEEIPKWITALLENGRTSFYKEKENIIYYYNGESYQPKEANEKEINLIRIKKEKGVIKKNSGASLIDLGDDIACLEFHSPNNAIGPDIIQMVNIALEEVSKNYKGLVIGNQGKSFCVGANLAMILMEAQDDNYFELEMMIKQFQDMTMKIKYAEKPVVAAPFQMTLGGGAEIALPASRIQAHQETYMGLVEFGVGLIPGGGGTKELYLKALRDLPKGVSFDITKVTNDVFEKVAMAKTSTSAEEAKELGYLNNYDGISANLDYLLYDAKQQVLALANKGFQPRKREKVPVVGNAGYAAMLLGAKSLYYSGYASRHDLKIADKLAYVLSGGGLREGSLIDEQVMLDLEREAFLSLLGEPLTQARMQHMLVKGKPLRN